MTSRIANPSHLRTVSLSLNWINKSSLLATSFLVLLGLMSFLMQAFRAPSQLNSRKKRPPQVVQDATGLNTVARDPTNHNKIPRLHVLCCQENIAAAAELIAQGADVNERDTMGNTALHVAAAYGCQEAITLLISIGANPTLCNKNGRKASDVVCAKLNDKRKRHAIVGLLSLSELRIETENNGNSTSSIHEPCCLEDLINSRLKIAETTKRFESTSKHQHQRYHELIESQYSSVDDLRELNSTPPS
eukprot:g7528.t1